VLDLLPDPTWIKDPRGRYLVVNEPFAALVGSPRSAIEGRVDREVWESGLAEAFRADDQAVAASGKPCRTVVPLPRSDGRPRWMEVVRAPFLQDGRPAGLAGRARDVTERIELDAERERDRERLEQMVQERTRELATANARLRAEMDDRRRAEASLHRAQKLEALGRLAGGVVHDVNNLLAVVKSCAEALHLGIPPEEVGELAFEIAEAARRGTALTRQLLAFSRQGTVQPREVELNRLVEGMSGMLARLMPAGVRVAASLGAEPLVVRADPGQIEQVVMNLVVNARDAMPGGGAVTLATGRAPGGDPRAASCPAPPGGAFAFLSVTDEGVGMSDQVQARIFEPFFTTKEPGKGTGLGLATVFGIARQCGGTVAVRSAPGEGARFDVLLPLTPDRSDRSAS
jgi:PAS domain S-box-containing protein